MTEPRAVYGTQVAMGSCVFKPQPEAAVLGAIGAALLSSAVSQGVNYLGKAITEAAKENTDRVTAVRNVEVTNETFGPCFQVARGWFFEGFATATERAEALGVAETTWARAGQDQAVDEGRLTLLWQRRMWIAAQPDFVLGAEIVPSSAEKPNERVLTMAPVYARLEARSATPCCDRRGRGKWPRSSRSPMPRAIPQFPNALVAVWCWVVSSRAKLWFLLRPS